MENNKILLTSANYVREVTNISDNVNEKVLYAAIRESQDIELRNIIGSKMLKKLKSLVAEDLIKQDEYTTYNELLEETQYFLAYTVITKLCLTLNFKLDNAGLLVTSDEHISNLDVSDTFTLKDWYQKRADYYCMLLQNWCLRHRSELPELDEGCCRTIRSNLYSSFTNGLFLGGRRNR